MLACDDKTRRGSFGSAIGRQSLSANRREIKDRGQRIIKKK